MEAPCPAENRADQKESTSGAEPIRTRTPCKIRGDHKRCFDSFEIIDPRKMSILCAHCHSFQPYPKYASSSPNQYGTSIIEPKIDRSVIVEKGTELEPVCEECKCKGRGPKRLEIGRCVFQNGDKKRYRSLFLQILTHDKTDSGGCGPDGCGPDPYIRIVVGPEHGGCEPDGPEQAE